MTEDGRWTLPEEEKNIILIRKTTENKTHYLHIAMSPHF
jgi:hypothetical protein